METADSGENRSATPAPDPDVCNTRAFKPLKAVTGDTEAAYSASRVSHRSFRTSPGPPCVLSIIPALVKGQRFDRSIDRSGGEQTTPPQGTVPGAYAEASWSSVPS